MLSSTSAVCLTSLLLGLAVAGTQSNVANPESDTRDGTFRAPTYSLLEALQRQYARVLTAPSWAALQLLALCGLLGFTIIWRKNNAIKRRNAMSSTSTIRSSSTSDKRAGVLPMKAVKFGTDMHSTDPGLLKKHSSLRSYTTSFGHYPAIRVFKREHPQADKLPSKPTPLPLLVFIHGLGGALAQFHPLLTSLVNVAPCLGIDLPGCGLSSFLPTTWEAYSQQALVELIATVIADACRENVNQGVILIGHSMGCSLGAILASPNSPLKAKNIVILGLIAICPKATPPTVRQLAWLRRIISLPTPVLDFVRYWDRRGGLESASVARYVGPGADIETKKLQKQFNLQSQSAVWRRMVWGLYPNTKDAGWKGGQMASLQVWAQLTMPIFLIAGESDTITSPDEISAIGRVLGKMDRPPCNKNLDAVTTSTLRYSEECKNSDRSNHPFQVDVGSVAEFDTQTTVLNNQDPFQKVHPDPSRFASKKHQVLKTTILPRPAAHSLLYDPHSYRILAGLIQKFLWDHVDSRLSLGWQLQHLSIEGKWDVKNLVKWQAVRPVSEPIAHVFRAMKTLREIDDVHCPEIFVRDWKGKLKAVIDISHENPVYDPRGLDTGGIEYHKFPTVSKIPPTADEVREFIKLVDRIRQTDSVTAAADALIGVHCHYGFNRTGFFICSYLIEKERYGVQQAIDEFQARRPPGIRHDHFLDTLFVRYCVGLKRAPTF
ncbi:MAG: hypothetical protein Q9219_007003 [cf. Caloplaca sp. 3 TL-2023]